ncbi:hypothetical protein GCM10009087_44590 [Sphingomonas oligophenolica]|uniref:Uncharacterized protein n=1 Tax=Sphingomonas oligophenolica TaxID=301154 RepID=A0ABU9XZY0_9SPHN
MPLTPPPAAASCWKAPRCDDREAREAARAFNLAAEGVTDFVSTTISGLSAKARVGHSLEQLLATARLAGMAIARALPA